MVLIVEDDAITRELYADILRNAGLACVATATAAQALELATAQRFDAVLLDVGLPRVSDGLRLALKLRSLPEPPPMVASTGHLLEPWTAKLFHAALKKPVDMNDVVSSVKSAIARGAQLGFPFPGTAKEEDLPCMS
jgi:CheY-like chemotaxis protein